MKKFLASFALAALLAGCGGGSDAVAPTQVATSDTTLAANATTTAAAAQTPFAFPAGVTQFGTTAPTTVTFTTSAAATPTFSIASGSGTATGTLAFGSCIFSVKAVTGTVGSLHVGDTVTVDPCTIRVGTGGMVANGVGESRSIALVLGAAASANATITVGVNPGGQLTLNGTIVGTVTLAPLTGA